MSVNWSEIGKWAGAAIGFYFGGPEGAAVGAAAGERLGEEADGDGGGDSEEEWTSALETGAEVYGIASMFGGSGEMSGDTTGIGPVADGNAYADMLGGSSGGTTGIGPVADGDQYADMLGGGGSDYSEYLELANKVLGEDTQSAYKKSYDAQQAQNQQMIAELARGLQTQQSNRQKEDEVVSLSLGDLLKGGKRVKV